jgi:hypothetical protein
VTSVVLSAACRVEESGERRKDCVDVRAGFGWRKFLPVVRVARGTVRVSLRAEIGT